MKKNRGWISLAVKLNVLILSIIFILAGGLVAIAYRVNSERVDRYFKQTTAYDAAAVAAFIDGDFARELLQAIQTEDFEQVRSAALAAEDEDLVRNWLWEKNLYERFTHTMDVLRTYQERLQVRFLYIQFNQGNLSTNLLDPDEDLLYLGSAEISAEEFGGAYQGNERIEPTVSTTEFGWLCSAYEPVYASDGEAVAIVGVDIDMNDVMHERHQFLISMLIFAGVLMIISVAVSMFLMRRMATKPLSMLSKATIGFADSKDGYTKDDVIDLPIRSKDEIGDLYHEIRSMQVRMVEYLDNLTRVTAEKERIGTELALATRIQADMLPNIFPAFPERTEFDIYATMTPAKEVGGDFYDFFLIDDNHLGLVMADVSGKGVPAALFMMISKILVQNYAMTGRSPAEVLRDVNNQICSNNREEMFVTVWFGVLDTRTGKITAANAGHEYPALMPSGGQFELVKDKHGFVIGGMEGMRYKEYELQLTPGAKLFLYTDGVPEATDANKELFGTDRMLAALNADASAAPEEILKQVRGAVDGFVKDAEQFDDLTMLCLEYRGGNTDA